MSKQNYTLGRGELFFDRFDAGTFDKTGERYFGHTPEFTINVESESLDHWNADRGVKVKDESVLLQITRQSSFTTDSINAENLALFFLGEALTITEAGGPVTAEPHTAKVGYFIQLGADDDNPAGVRGVSSVTVSDDASGSYTEGEDYDVDLALGRIEVLEGGTITDGTNLEIDYTVDATTRSQVITKNSQINGALRFVAYNAKGDDRDYYMPYVRISPTGDFALKSDEWQTLGFQCEILELPNSDTAAIYADGRPVANP